MIEDILHDVALSYLLEREPVGASEEVVQSFPPGIDLARTVARFNLALSATCFLSSSSMMFLSLPRRSDLSRLSDSTAFFSALTSTAVLGSVPSSV